MRLNFSILTLLLAVFAVIFVKILFTTASDIQKQVAVKFELTNAALEAQINYVSIHALEHDDHSSEHLLGLINLAKFSDLNYINIELLDSHNTVIATNYSASSAPSPWLIERLEHILFFGLFHPIDKRFHSIDATQTHQGKIVVSVDIEAKLNALWRKTLTALTPIGLIFLLVYLVSLVFVVFIIKPLTEFLSAHNPNVGSNELNSNRLSLVAFISTLRNKLQGIHNEFENTSRTVDALNDRILHLQEDERRHLSAELHDELGQHLTAIRFEAEAIIMAKTLDEAKQSAQAIDLIGRNMKDIVRSMLQRLRPPELALFGLKDTLSEMVTDWQQSHPQSHIDFTCQADFSQLDEAKQLNIYRIIQEGLTNISRHAGLTGLNITISLLSTEKQVNILIADDGQGCDLTQPRSGFGLNGMRERVETCGGTISLNSSPKQGMTITIAIPNKSEKVDE